MKMNWNFGLRSGLLSITNFDVDKNFSGLMFAPGKVQFGGLLAGSGLAGAASGAFVGPNGDLAPKGVIGDFAVGSNTYKATGIFGGTKQ